jgi:hypothetical protein
MATQQKNFSKTKTLSRVAIAAITLATLSFTLNAAAPGCMLLHPIPWLAANVVRLLVLRADWQTLLPYLCEGSKLLQDFLQFVTCP